MKPFQVMRLRSNAAAPTTGLIDSFTTSLWGAYGLVLLRGNYGGSALRVRRSSDSAEQDIGFVGAALDTASMLTFVGSNNGFVTKWYDQSGAGNDMLQATTTKQAQIVDTGVYMGEITLDGVDDFYQTSSNSGTPTAFVVHFAGRQRMVDVDRTTIGHASGARAYLHPGAYNSNYGVAMAGATGGLSTNDEQQTSDQNTLTFQWDRANAGGNILQNQVWTNGVNKAGTNGGGTPATGSYTAGIWTLGSIAGTSQFSHLACKTLLIYEAVQSGTTISSIAALLKPVPAVGGLDSFTTSLWGLYSLRKQRTAFAGSSIRVRRSSDNTEQDIGFVSGFLDTASLLTFVGSNNGFLSKWYDQSASGNDLAQTTQANQPRIVNAGVVDLGVVFDGSNDYLISANNSGTPSGMTVYFRGMATSAGTTLIHFEHNAVDPNNSVRDYRSTTAQTWSNLVESSVNKAIASYATVPAGQVISSVHDRTLTGSTNISKMYSSLQLTGTSQGGAALTSTTYLAKPWSVGSRNGTLPWAGYLLDFVIYETAHAAATVERVSRAIG